MLMLMGLLPLALIGFAIDSSGDDGEDTVEINGTDAADRIEGVEGDDFLDGEAGDDVLSGRAGDDTVFGRDGMDVLQGQDGNDMLCSGDGNDIVTGNTGTDFIEGQEGDDWVSGDYGSDTLTGNEGNDTVLGGRGTDLVQGAEGDDLLFGAIIQGVPLNLEEMEDLRDGGSLAEINGGIEIRDDSFGNALLGGDGNDDLVIGSMDTVAGGANEDTFHIMSEQTDDGEALIQDYNSNVDALTIIVDDTEADHDISVTDDGDDAIIRLGDQVLARLSNAAGTFDVSDITLIAETTVEGLFDPNAPAV